MALVRRWVAAAGLALCVIATAACGGGEDPSGGGEELPARIVSGIPAPRDGQQASGTFVAAAGSATTPYLALVVQDGDVVAFVCDGDQIGEPLGGTTSGSRFDLSRHAVRVTGTVADGVVTGELTVPGAAPTTFLARPAVEGTTGLYRAKTTLDGEDAVTWWIQTEDGIKGSTVGRNKKRGFATSNPAGFEGAVVGEAPPKP